MTPKFRPTTDADVAAALICDQLVIAGYTLYALEAGAMPMHAGGYRAIARWASDELETMDTDTLRLIHALVPRSLQTIVENTVHAQGSTTWSADDPVRSAASAECSMLLQSLRSGR